MKFLVFYKNRTHSCSGNACCLLFSFTMYNSNWERIMQLLKHVEWISTLFHINFFGFYIVFFNGSNLERVSKLKIFYFSAPEKEINNSTEKVYSFERERNQTCIVERNCLPSITHHTLLSLLDIFKMEAKKLWMAGTSVGCTIARPTCQDLCFESGDNQ